LTVLADVETFSLFFRRDTNTHDHLQDTEDNVGEDKSEGTNRKCADQLDAESGSITEERDSKCAENTTDTVHGDRTDWIINLDLIEEDDGEDNEDTSDEASQDRIRRHNGVSTGSDADPTAMSQ
jgi:hypothetical protein